MIHTVIFDVGGTIIEAPDLFQELSKLFSNVNIKEKALYEIIKDELMGIYKSIGTGTGEFIKIEKIIERTLSSVCNELNCDDKTKYAREKYYDVFLKQANLCDDTVRVLKKLEDRNINMIIASDADAELLYLELQKFNVDRFFDRYYISSEIEAYKPSDLFVTEVEKSLSTPKEGILFVGDSDVDIITGNKLGVKTVLKGNLPNASIKPDYQIKSLKEILSIINNM